MKSQVGGKECGPAPTGLQGVYCEFWIPAYVCNHPPIFPMLSEKKKTKQKEKAMFSSASSWFLTTLQQAKILKTFLNLCKNFR